MAEPIRVARETSRRTHGPLLDFRLGYALLRDRRVPLPTKILALLIGIATIILIEFVEIPLEEIIALVPVLGILGDTALAGAEILFGPIILAALLMPYMAPETIVDRVRRERDPGAGFQDKPIIDI